MSVRDLVAVLKARWLFLACGVVIGLLGGLVVTLTTAPTYSSSAETYVSTPNASSIADLSTGSGYAQQVVASYVHVATADYVLDPVISELGLQDSASQLASRVDVASPVGTVVINITVDYPNSKMAAQIANAIAAQLNTRAQDLASSSDSTSAIKVTTISSATPVLRPVSPKPLQNLVLGLVAGLAGGLAVALLLSALDTTVRTAAMLEEITGAPVLGSVPFNKGKSLGREQSEADTQRNREAYRGLQASLRFISVGHDDAVYVVTSSIAGEGKSTTVAGLAAAAAAAGSRVCVVDADLRRPSLHALFGIEGSLGVTTIISGMADLDPCLQSVNSNGGVIAVLPAGDIPPNPIELLQSKEMNKLIAELSGRFDVILIDSPPLLPVADAGVLAANVSGALFVSSVSSVSRNQVAGAMSVLRRTGGTPVGLILSKMRAESIKSQNYYQTYLHEPPALGRADV